MLRSVVIAFALFALAAPVGAKPLPVAEIAPGVFVHQGVHQDFTRANRGGIANIGFVVGSNAVAVIDSGGSRGQGQDLRAAIENQTTLPITYVINTHAHPDHVLGNAAFLDLEPTFVGHAKLPRALAERGPHYLARLTELMGDSLAGSALIPPDVVVEGDRRIDLGGRVLELQAWPTAHTDCDLTVLDRATGTLFAGDLVFIGRIPVIDGRLLGWLDVLEELATLPATRAVPGHGPASAPWPSAIDDQRTYLSALRDSLRSAIERGVPLSRATEDTPVVGDWELAADTHPRNVMTGYTELEWE